MEIHSSAILIHIHLIRMIDTDIRQNNIKVWMNCIEVKQVSIVLMANNTNKLISRLS